MKIIALVLFCLLAAACSSADCESLCKEAQSRSCTSISGDCGAFCTSLERVSAAGNCDNQRDEYHACLNDDDVCTGTERCGSKETALGNCTGAYCLANSNNADCQVLVGSL
jgi:hypothetical protein